MHATWSRIGHPPEVPVTGERKSVKILGAIDLWHTRFHYQQDTIFNANTYLAFLEQLARKYRRRGAILIQDNASYHKDAEVWKWFGANRHWLEVHQLPPYYRSSIQPNGSGNIRGRPEHTIATLPPRRNYSTLSPGSSAKCSPIRS